MSYKVVEQNKAFNVMEERKVDKTAAEQVLIKTFSTRQEAKLFMRKLNGGMGFNGWTPSFFLIPVKVK